MMKSKIILSFLGILLTISLFAEWKEEILEISNIPYTIEVYSNESKETIFILENNGDSDINDISLTIESQPKIQTDMKIFLFPDSIHTLKSGENVSIKLTINYEKPEYFSKFRKAIIMQIQSKEMTRSKVINFNILPPRNFWLKIISVFAIIMIVLFILIYKKIS